MALTLPFPKLSVTSKTTKKEMLEYIETLEAYALKLLNEAVPAGELQVVADPKQEKSILDLTQKLTVTLADVSTAQKALKSIENIVIEKDVMISELQKTVNNLQGELNILKGYNDKAATLETQLIEKLVPLKRRK